MPQRILSRLGHLLALLLVTVGSVVAQPTTPPAPPTKQVVDYLARVQHLIQQHALYADSLDWPQLQHEVMQQAQGLTTVAECQPLLKTMLRTLHRAGDKHSFFLPKATTSQWTSPTYAGQPAQSQYVEPGIGYLQLPALQSIAPAVERRFAQRLQQQVLTQQIQHALTGWIVDLRHNTGGNAYPMLAGLQALLGDETCGYLVYPRRQAENAVHSQPIKKQRPQLPAAAPTPLRVAVLLDSLTGSSGELVAIAFKGLPNTRFFGQPSAGYTTATQHFKLSDGTYLVLTTGYMTDRHHVAYLTGIVPDVVVDATLAHTPDSTLEAAKRWLLEAP